MKYLFHQRTLKGLSLTGERRVTRGREAQGGSLTPNRLPAKSPARDPGQGQTDLSQRACMTMNREKAVRRPTTLKWTNERERGRGAKTGKRRGGASHPRDKSTAGSTAGGTETDMAEMIDTIETTIDTRERGCASSFLHTGTGFTRGKISTTISPPGTSISRS